MKHFKNITLLLVFLIFAFSCNKEIDNLKELSGVTAPTEVSAKFDITQDNSGLVTVFPNAEGVTEFLITFGDVADETPTKYGINETITHTYEEGVFSVGITASGITGLTTKIEEVLNVTFKAPENLVVTIDADAVQPNIISVSATADNATVMDIYFGDIENEEPTLALPAEVVTHTYEAAGDYIIRVVAKSGGTATTEYSETITISEASDPVTLPIDFESFTVNYAFDDFGNAVSSVIDNPYVSTTNSSDRVGTTTKTTGAETWAGSLLTLGTPIDFSSKKLFKVKVWSPKSGAIVKLKIENIDNGDIAMEVDATTTTSNEWELLTYDFSSIDMNESYQKVVLFFDFDNVGDDSIYYFDDIKQASASSGGSGVVGTWKIKPEAGSIGVGPELGDMSWWSIDAAGVEQRACFYDDTYVFGADGSFSNVLGTETWIETWQGVEEDACGTPVAPHDGSAATFTYNETASTVTLNGTGSYLGIPKAYNGGELALGDVAPESIIYDISFSDDNMEMTVDINIGSGWWRFIMVKEGSAVSSPIEGTWQVSPTPGSIGVGPELGDISWWSIDPGGVEQRACFYDDTYVFGADGSFSNVLGDETWVEEWQGLEAAGCGALVAPHDGSNAATYTYDEGASTVTLNGVGAFLGIPKAYNGGELALGDPAPESITYDIAFSEENTVMTVDINIGSGWWRYILVKN